MEGFWYWLGRQDDRLRHLNGYEAKTLGRTLPIVNVLDEPTFQATIRVANFTKLTQHPRIMMMLVNSTLPFTHYYVFNGFIKNAGYAWLVRMWEELRAECMKLNFK
jgi:hypothetical protein